MIADNIRLIQIAEFAPEHGSQRIRVAGVSGKAVMNHAERRDAFITRGIRYP
jgi:hypothetical protein